MLRINKFAHRSLIAWSGPVLLVFHILTHQIIMRFVPEWRCSFHNNNEYACGMAHWHPYLGWAFGIGLFLVFTAFCLATFYYIEEKLNWIGKTGLALSAIIIGLTFGLVITA